MSHPGVHGRGGGGRGGGDGGGNRRKQSGGDRGYVNPLFEEEIQNKDTSKQYKKPRVNKNEGGLYVSEQMKVFQHQSDAAHHTGSGNQQGVSYVRATPESSNKIHPLQVVYPPEITHSGLSFNNPNQPDPSTQPRQQYPESPQHSGAQGTQEYGRRQAPETGVLRSGHYPASPPLEYPHVGQDSQGSTPAFGESGSGRTNSAAGAMPSSTDNVSVVDVKTDRHSKQRQHESVTQNLGPIARNLPLQTSTLTKKEFGKALQNRGPSPDHPMVWDRLELEILSHGKSDISSYVAPCSVQFALQKNTGKSVMFLEQNGIELLEVNVGDNKATCKLSVKTIPVIWKNLVEVFRMITEGFDCAIIHKNSPECDVVLSKNKDQLPKVFLNDRAEIYIGNVEIYVVGESEIFGSMYQELIHPIPDARHKGNPDISNVQSDQEEPFAVPAWGSVHLYIQPEERLGIHPMNCNASEALNPYQVQYVLQKAGTIEKCTDDGLKVIILIEESNIVCKVFCSKSMSKEDVERSLLSVFTTHVLCGLQTCFICKDSKSFENLRKIPTHQICQSKTENGVEVYDCNDGVKVAVVGYSENVRQFFKDLGLTREHMEMGEFGEETQEVQHKLPNTDGGAQVMRGFEIKASEECKSDRGKPLTNSRSEFEVDQDRNQKEPATTCTDIEDNQKVNDGQNFLEKENVDGREIITSVHKTNNEEITEEITRNARQKNDERDTTAANLMDTGTGSKRIAGHMKDAASLQNKDERQSEHSSYQVEPAWEDSIIGFLTPGARKPCWFNITAQLDPGKLQFALTNNSRRYKDDYTDKLKKEGISTTVLPNGILCTINDETVAKQSAEQQQRFFLDVFHSKVGKTVGTYKVKNGSVEHDIVLKNQLLPIRVRDVSVYQSTTDDFVCLVGDNDELDCVLRSLKDKVGKNSSFSAAEAESKENLYQNGWRSVTFTVKYGSETHKLNAPVYLDLALLQFALTCEEDRVCESFRNHNVDFKVHVENKQYTFFVDDSKGRSLRAVERTIGDVFEEVFSFLEKQYFEEGMAQRVCDGLGKRVTVPQELTKKLVAVYMYIETKTVCVVGRTGKARKVLEMLEMPITEGKQCLMYCDEAIQLLHELDFEDYLKQRKNEKIAKLEFGKCMIKLQGANENMKKVEKELKGFLENVFYKRITFADEGCEKLLLTNDDSINETVFNVIKDELRKKSSVTHDQAVSTVFGLRTTPGGTVELVCRNKSSYDFVASEIQGMIVHMNIVIKSKEGTNVLESGINAKRARVLKNGEGGVFEIVCTLDFNKELTSAEEKEEKEIRLAKLVMSFLQEHGHALLRSIEKETDVKVSLRSEHLFIRGTQANIKAFEKQFKEQISKRRRSVPAPVNDMTFEQAKLDEVVKNYGCCKIQQTSQSDKVLNNCKYLASWFSPIDSCKLTVVEGSLSQTDADVVIILVNDSLCPLEMSDIEAAHIMEQGFLLSRKVNRRFKLGEVHFRTVKKDAKTQVASIVAFGSENQNVLSIKKTMLQNKIKQILRQAVEKNLQTVLIDSRGVTDHITSEMVVQAAALGAQDYFLNCRAAKLKEFFICCAKTPAKAVVDHVHKCFRRCKQYGRKVYPAVTEHLQKMAENQLTAKVEVESLLDIKADIIVNSTSCSLNLSDGFVSKEILAQGGKEIQDALKKNYPDKISFGEVAVTTAFGLERKGIKYIFHAALPFKDISPDVDWKYGVKQFVKVCLYKANALEGKKIAFPALGVGNLKCPWRVSAQAMFDAIEEFQEEVINLNLKTVKIALHKGDQKTCDVFLNEEWRRSKQFEKQMGPPPPCPTTGYPVMRLASQRRPHVFVCKQSDIRRSSDAVEIIFVLKALPGQKRFAGANFKSASQDPKSFHDTVTILLEGNGGAEFVNGIELCWKVCLAERATEVIIYTSNNLQFSCGFQVKTIVGVFQKRNNGNQKGSHATIQYLRNIFIVVPDESGLQNVSDTCSSEKQSMWETSIFQDEGKVDITVELIGKTPELASKAEDEVKQLLKKAMEMKKQPKAMGATNNGSAAEISSGAQTDFHLKGARPKDSNAAYKMADDQVNTTRIQQGIVELDGDDGFVDYDQIFGSISAVINPGIIAYKKDIADLQPWISKIEKLFSLTKSFTLEGYVQVQGSFDEVSRFQEYLDNDFPDDPKQISADDAGTATTEASDKVDMKMSVDASSDTDIVFDRNKTTEFKLGSIVVKLSVADLKTQDVDCIAISNQPTLLNRHGMAMHVAEAAGLEYKRECETSGKTLLKPTECRITSSGNLMCETVAHVYVPTFKLKDSMSSLIELEKSVTNCFKEIDRKKRKSVALPCIGAGSSKFPINYCAQQYVKALNWLRLNNTFLKTVVFVDLNGDCLQCLHDELRRVPDVQVRQVHPAVDEMVISAGSQGTDVDTGLSIEKKVSPERQQSSCTDVKYWELKTSKSGIKVYVCKADVTAISTDAVVCPENENFKGEGKIARQLRQLGGDFYQRQCENLSLFHSKVVSTRIDGGSLRCKFVMHSISPRWSRRYCQNAGLFEAEMKDILKAIFSQTNLKRLDSLAIPLLGTGDKREDAHTPLETCCRAMISGIQDYLEKNLNSYIKRVEICCVEDVVQSAFNNELTQRSAWKGVK